MALELYIPPCIRTPAHPFHLPPWKKPLRICIEGPLVSVQKLLPDVQWHVSDSRFLVFPQPAGPELAKLTYRALYGREVSSQITGDMVVRDEYLGWVMKDRRPLPCIDYYGVTFDHHVPVEDDEDPEVLQINIIEMDDDAGEYANDCLLFTVNPADYTGKKVLAVPRCCGKRKGKTDRFRINSSVVDREGRMHQSKFKERLGPTYMLKYDKDDVRS
ncbi:uncharacterized protein TRIVIDRAFT_218286 [Trichoderma virens Gv29-8]|uniref:Uncharacterized protein n=1 Tax=Hypocrea virens (strain Gv29-8 / FGSC 10586) TaxID=413071 RepID=G9MHC6_HYPVG|nr:uncharacterized protein TRIVIDRAFT_218286 [Trichoderma virens Gv29-8]EHK26114.1 hypothetical protein TRIVIDRAFT_218286 [Trichoderma virens Gv29-8]UKZ46300.1 hypothetical protein TrVGV298_000501 [Trichoderma virens]